VAIEGVVLLGCGDIGPVHEPMETYGALARPILAAADIRFGQCERTYSENSGESVEASAALQRGNRPLKPHMVSIFTDSGFDVVSLAGNHIMDWASEGYDHKFVVEGDEVVVTGAWI